MSDRYKLVNGKIKLSSQENSQRDIEEKKWTDGQFDRAIENLRNDRNKLLFETDFYGVSDNKMTEEMTKYRQDLRDITNGLTTVEQVNAVEFPTKPE